MGKPPLGQDKACFTEKVLPHSQLEGVRLGGQSYRKASASRKAPLCSLNPNSAVGRAVNQLEDSYFTPRPPKWVWLLKLGGLAPRSEVGIVILCNIAVGTGKGLLDSLRGREVGYRCG